jgi:YYY domain-containing protein
MNKLRTFLSSPTTQFWRDRIYDVLLIFVLLVAAYLRFSGSDWGELEHQHPDELFLTSVTLNIQPVQSLSAYFDTAQSTLNPHNRGDAYYVYGTLPIFIVRYLADWTGYLDNVKLLGRIVSAVADLGTILLLYFIVARLYKRRVALFAAAFSALAVMQIQQSHFYTTDLFANFFMFLATLFAVEIALRKPRVARHEPLEAPLETDVEVGAGAQTQPIVRFVQDFLRDPDVWLSTAFGFALGMSAASKLYAAPLAILLPGAFVVRYFLNRGEGGSLTDSEKPALTFEKVIGYLVIGALFSLLAFRIFQPYAFSGPGFLGIKFDPLWMSNIAEQRVQARGDADLPWNLQWARRTHLYSFENLTVWGLGLPLGVLAWAGFLWMGWRILKGEWRHVLLWGWMAAYFLWQSLEFNPTMRYQLPIYPLLAMMAAWFVFEIGGMRVKKPGVAGDAPATFNLQPLAWILGGFVFIATLAWAFAFASIYTRPEPRIAASRWIYENVPGPINLRIQAPGEATYNQPLPFSQGLSVGQDVPYETGFTALSSGELTEVVLGHVVDGAASGSQTLTLSLASAPSAPPDQILASGAVTMDFAPHADSRGESVTIKLDRVVTLEKDKGYYLRLETTGGALAFSGASFANETDYDFPLPFRIDGYDGFGGIFRGDLNLQVYWDDNAEKLARFLDTLDQSDYIFIPTNHQYGQITRLPERYPLTTVYYRELIGCPPDKNIIWCYRTAEPGTFQGRLGYDLVATFESYPTLGPLVINDQAAEEAFTFYDHPKVMVFKKRADYDPRKVAAVLGAVDLSHVIHLTPRQAGRFPSGEMTPPVCFNSVALCNFLGASDVMKALQAQAGKLSLSTDNSLLSMERVVAQRAGGTWSALFNTDAIYNRYPGIGLVMWYLAIFVLGLFSYPIVRLAFPGLADRGYPLARIVGLVLWAWLSWIAGSYGIPYTRTTIGLMLGLILLAGAVLGYVQREALRVEWETKRRYFLTIEGLFLGLFLIDVLIRLGNPDLWHPARGGERPMNFSMFNAVIKSTTFPPYDAWFAGGYINYYYFGYVIVGTPVKFLGIVPTIAYNFILPILYSILGMCGFSVAWNLIAATRPHDEDPAAAFTLQFYGGSAAMAGLVLLGNLGVVRMLYQGFQRLAAPGGVIDNASIPQRLVWAAIGLFKSLSGTPLPFGPGDWYWNPSRVIPPGPGNEITEFPLFTFLYSDMHAHMIAFSLTVVAIAWALSVVLAKAKWPGRLSLAVSFFIGALFIGGLYPANTWDFPTYLALNALVLGYAVWRYFDVEKIPLALPRASRRALAALVSVVVLGGLSLALYQPFRQWFGQGYNEVQPWLGPYTPIWSYFAHWGLFLFIIIAWMAWETREWMAATPLSSLNKLRPYQIAIELALVVFAAAVVALLFIGVSIGWFVLPLAVWAMLLVFRPGQSDAKRLTLFMISTALSITIVVELVTLVGDIGRMNTIFKFYLQAWMLLAVSSGAAFAWLLPELGKWRTGWRSTWQLGLWLLVFGAALFPVMGSFDKISDRMTTRAPHTFDSMAYMNNAIYSDQGVDMDLSQDYRAIRWMQENVQGSPVIVETNCPEYRWCTRFTIYTGLPGVVGWNWHERQQRTLTPPEWVTDRVDQIGQFYTTSDIQQALAFLKRYDVSYIIVGQLEHAFYGNPGSPLSSGLLKFEVYNGRYWQDVYREGQTVIYRVLPQP